MRQNVNKQDRQTECELRVLLDLCKSPKEESKVRQIETAKAINYY